MLRFCGFGLELFIDEVLERDHDDPVVCSATDFTGQRWLIVEAERKDKDLSWLCAPASTRAVDLVAAGLTSAADAVRHSTTGWVEVVSVIDGHSVPDRRLSCSDLSAKHPLATPLSL
jgi:hypothetical protein